MILMIDNYDSFTYNIVQYCLELGADMMVIKNDELTLKQIEKLNPNKIIISPGPSTPNDAGISLDVIEHFKDKIPILGICLGHQAIAQNFGAKIIRAKNVMHGKESLIIKKRDTLMLKDIPNSFKSARYHSLVIQKENLPSCILTTAISQNDKEIMAIEIKDKHLYGVQFHPESIISQYGHKILANFLSI